MMKRILAMLLSIVMVFSMVPVQAFAQETPEETVAETETAVPTETEAPAEETLPPEPTTAPTEAAQEETLPAEQETTPATEVAEEILIPGEAMAATSGTCGSNLTWNLAGGVLTISGTGAMSNYSSSATAPWFSERLSITSVVVENGVTYIGDYAFYYCSNLASVSIGGSVASIGDYAFQNCTALKTVDIPDGVKTIYDYAFHGCTALHTVNIQGNTLMAVSYGVFYNCSSLQNITLPESVTEISGDAFRGCTSLREMEIPSGVKSIASEVFYGCTSLESVTFRGNNVTSIGSSAFYNCGKLWDFEIPAEVKSIGYNAFVNCASLTEIKLPEGISGIGSDTFSGCTGLTEIEIPKSVVTISDDAFNGCTGLKSVTMHEGLVSISYRAFQNCTALTKTEIPNTVTGIGESAFRGCTLLKDVTLSDNLQTLGGYAFYGCTALTQIAIPGSVKALNGYTFYGCTALTNVTLKNGLQTIGDSAFYGCTALTNVTLTNGLQTIGGSAFYGCTALTFTEIPDSVTSIGSGTFYGCTSLTKAVLSKNLESIPYRLFYGCTALTNMNLDELEKVKSIGEEAFCNCDALESVTIPDSVETVSNAAFYNCDALESVTISGSVDTVGNYAFKDCDALQTVTMLEGLEGGSIGSEAFYDCDSLKTVDIQAGVQGINYRAFYSCDSLEEVSIPATVSAISDVAFAYCPELTKISFGHEASHELAISYDAFYLHTDSYKKDQPTTVYVPYARNIHSAISGYEWAYYGREVSYESTGYLPATSIKINTPPAELEVGLEVTLTATVDPWYATSDLIWEVKNETGKATITQDGVLTAVAPGFVTVICKSSDDVADPDDTQIEIKKATGYVESIIVRCNGDFEAEVELGQKVQMIADVRPGNAMNKAVTWSVENGTGTATITKDGVLTGKTCGKVTVYAMAQDGTEVMGSRVVEILRYVTEIDILINGQAGITELGVGETAILNTVITPENASYPNVTWTVENITGEAKLSSNNNTWQIKGISSGEVTLTATSQDSRHLPKSIELDIVGENLSVAVGGGNLYYNSVTGTITGCDDGVTSANIPGIIKGTKITSIAPHAFYNKEDLTSVTIPSSVERIGDRAFYYCRNLSSLKINGEGLKYIGEYAFYDCESLSNLTVPAGVESIGKYAFEYCSGLINLVIPENIGKIGQGAFYGLSGLKNLTIPGDLDTTYILGCNTLDTVTFTGKSILPQKREQYDEHSWHIETMPGREAKKIIITDTVTSIGSDAFCSKDVEEVTIGTGVVTIGDYAFSGCDKLTAVTMGDAVKSIGSYAFAECNRLKEIAFGAGMNTIGEYAFRHCENLTSVSFDKGLKTIGVRAFESCDSLEKVVLPDGIETIGDYAFYMCRSLKQLNLPDTLKKIGRRALDTYSEGPDQTAVLQLIDLSGNPSKMSGQEMKLTCNLPAALVKGAGKNLELEWDLLYIEGIPNPYEIAWIEPEEGVLNARGIGTVTVVCRDFYTGARGTVTIEISSGIAVFAEGNETMIVSGDTLQLFAYRMPGEQKADVSWSIREQDREYATINASGKVTAKAVTSAHQIVVTARPHDGSDPVSIELWIVPRTTGLDIYEGQGNVTDTELNVDMAQIRSLQLTAVAQPEGAMNDVRWVSSNEKVATVEDGLVTFNKPGTVTISALANDGSGKSASVKIIVTYWDTAKELTATVDAPNNTLECGDTAQILVYGADLNTPLDIAKLRFSVPSSQTDIATVDHTGMITAGEKAGTVTITAELLNDPMGRSARIKITVRQPQTERLVLRAEAEEPAQVQMLDKNGMITDYAASAYQYSVLMKRADVEQKAYTFTVIPEAFTSKTSFQPEKNGLKWVSSNTKIATVAVNADGTATVTVKKGASGACVISAVTNDAAKVENRLTLNVRDFSPRLETAKPVLNTNLAEAAVLGLVPSYGNEIVAVSLWENGQESQRLIPEYENGVLTIAAETYIPDGSLEMTLKVTCADDETYPFNLSARVKNTAPAITVKQTEKINLFYSDSAAVLKITSAEAAVAEVTLADTDDFELEVFDQESGTATVRFSQDYIVEHSAKADTSATLLVRLDGYSQPVKKTFTIGTVNKKPSVQTSVSSSTVNTALSDEKTATFGFVLKGSTKLLDLANARGVDVIASFAEYDVYGDEVMLTLTGSSGGTAVIMLQLDNWMEPIKLSHKVAVTNKAPVLKFAATTLKLNSIFTEQTDATAAVMSQSNVMISSIRFAPAAKAGSAARAEAEKLEVEYDPNTGKVTARIADPDVAPKTGTYAFNAYATPYDGKELSAVTLKVNVAAAAPKVKLSSSTLKLNKHLSGVETATAAVTLDKAGYSLVEFRLPEDFDQEKIPVELDYVDGELTAFLLDTDADTKTHSIKLTPVVLDETTGQEAELPTAQNVKVQVYNNEKISVSLSSTGKLNAMDPNSQILYTVKKITNACGNVTGVWLEGDDADLFEVELNDDGTVSLAQMPGVMYSSKQTYKVQFAFIICGKTVMSGVQSIKVYQSVLKFTQSNVSCRLYQSQTIPMSVELTLDTPEGAVLDNIVLSEKSNKSFLDAMAGGDVDVQIAEDGRSAVVELDVRNPATLASGKSYVIYLEATAQCSMEDAKPVLVKVTVTVQS